MIHRAPMVERIKEKVVIYLRPTLKRMYPHEASATISANPVKIALV
jgi:hypothetical protein